MKIFLTHYSSDLILKTYKISYLVLALPSSWPSSLITELFREVLCESYSLFRVPRVLLLSSFMSKDLMNCSSNDCSFLRVFSTGEFMIARSSLLGIFSITELLAIQTSSSRLSRLSHFFKSWRYLFSLLLGETSSALSGAETARLAARLTGVLVI